MSTYITHKSQSSPQNLPKKQPQKTKKKVPTANFKKQNPLLPRIGTSFSTSNFTILKPVALLKSVDDPIPPTEMLSWCVFVARFWGPWKSFNDTVETLETPCKFMGKVGMNGWMVEILNDFPKQWSLSERRADTEMYTNHCIPEILTCPSKRDHFETKVVSQPSFFQKT